MTKDEETLVFNSDGGALEDARNEGSLLEEDDASSVAEEKKEVAPDDSSVPLADSFDDDEDGSNLEDVDNNTSVINSDDSKEDNTDDPRWSDVLCTPSNAAVFTPTADINSLKQNMHGWALKSAYDRTKVLSRSGKNCSQLLSDIANLNDELSNAMLKLRPTLDSAASGTPLDDFSTDINACFLSFVKQTNDLAACTQNDIVRPCSEYSAALVDEGAQVYSRYSESRLRCFQARKDALKMRQRCEASVKDAEGAAHALRNARMTKRKSSGDNVTTSAVVPLPQSVDDGEVELSLEETLKRFGKTHGLVKNCEAVASALAEIETSEKKYIASVEAENTAVADAQDIERQALDTAQQNEENRLLYMVGALERFLQMTRQAMDKMALDITAEPLELKLDSNPTDSPQPSTPKIFKSPRRLRTTSDDTGPSINETKLLNLPDELADLRDTMKSLVGRQSARLKALKLISTFNEGIANALENFAANIQSRLESDGFVGNRSDGKKSGPLAAQLKKNEGESMLSAWVIVINALKATAQLARDASKQVKGGNSQLYNILLQADKEIKTLKDGDEFRWKYLNDAAKSETKAKLKHSQLLIDLQKAKARLSTLEDDNGAENGNGSKNNAAPSMNKAMGKMFSILPGGGEHVMNQMLTPQQRQAVVMEQLKEAETKEAKAAEGAAAARSVKEQAMATYTTEAEASISKNESDERHTWELMQESLMCAVDAINRFRHGKVTVVSDCLNEMQTQSKIVVSNDISTWMHTAEKRIKDKRSRFITENCDNVDDAEPGFSLKVNRIDCTELRKLIERVLSDNNIDDSIVNSESAQIEPTSAAEEVPAEIAPKTKLPDVPKDPIIGKMDPIFTKKLKGVSIEKYYEKGWSDKINPLYSPWLERKGSFDVSVTEWEHSDQGFENKWSGERFHQRRTVKFKFKRTTHLYIGPPVAGVTQTQYCYKDGEDKCVIMMTVEMDGIPYSDVFAVEVRWAARRVGANDIAIDAGVFVNFIKSSMFASKIKSGTLIETKPIHLDLFEEIKKVLISDDNTTTITLVDAGDAEEEVENELSSEVVEQEIVNVQAQIESPWSQFSAMFMSLPKPAKVLALGMTSFFVMRFLFRKPDPTVAHLSRQVEDLGKEVKEIKAMLESVLEAVGDGKCRT